MARKKVVLFIVEGITDQESLALLLTELIQNDNEIIFQVVGGDITSSKDVNARNVKDKLTDIIKDSGKRKFRPSDYREVIHLVDMDGTFIPDDNIYQDNTAAEFTYKGDGIYSNNVENVIRRNHRKKKLLSVLTSTPKVFGAVPYRVFYFSCNLEHVLHNDRQVNDALKLKYAEDFQDKYIDDLPGFVDLICKSDFAVKKEYKESWDFIREANNSLERFSNFNVFLEDYMGD